MNLLLPVKQTVAPRRQLKRKPPVLWKVATTPARSRSSFFRPKFSVPLILIIGASTVLFFFEPGRYWFYPQCLLHQTTGLLCPGCGSLRAIHQLLHGHLLVAVHLNALLVLSTPVLGWFAVRSLIRSLNGHQNTFDVSPLWLGIFLVAGVLFAVLRNSPFAQAAWLAP